MRNQAYQVLSSPPDAGRNSATKPGKARSFLRHQAVKDQTSRLRESLFRQYALAFAIFIAVSLLNISLEDLIGYQAIALVYLLAMVVLALFVSRGPIIFGTALTALGWLFIAPPRFTFHLSSFYDKMMVATYFVVALTIGHLTTRLRAHRESEIKAKLLAESERL